MIVIPEAFPISTNELPWADDWLGIQGVSLKLIMADIEGARFAVRLKCKPGTVFDAPHKHTGEVHAYTLSGEWYYLEYPDLPHCKAGDYLFEPAGSTHTLTIASNVAEDTEMIFVVYGAMLYVNPQGEVVAVGDAESHLRDYPEALRQQGKTLTQKIPTGGAMAYRRPGADA